MPFLFSFLPRPLPCGSGDRWRAAQRSSIQTPVPVPPGSRQGFPTAMPASARHRREVPRRSPSGDQRARVRGPSEGRVICRDPREPHFCVLAPGACASKSACGRRSLPQRPLDIRCRRCVRREGRRPVLVAGPNQDPHSDADPRRSTPSREPGCLPPLRRIRRPSVGLLRQTDPVRRPLAHAAHTFSTSCGEVPSRALQAPECGHPRSLAFEEQVAFVTDGFDSFESAPCLGLTTQARPSARPSWLVCES
jgi:hypothetical protein